MRVVPAFLFTLAIAVSAGLQAGDPQAGVPASQAQPGAPATFHLYFLGHDIGTETDTDAPTAGGGTTRHAAFHFVDRGTVIDLAGDLTRDRAGNAVHFAVRGRSYRLFTADSDVTVSGDRAHVRDLEMERDVEIGARPFFPADTYAPIGFQDALIRYWSTHGRPREILALPAGVAIVRDENRRGSEGVGARSAGQAAPGLHRTRRWEALTIDGLVWGRETAFVDSSTHELVGLTTWAGNLPFEAVRQGYEDLHDEFLREAVAARMSDMAAWAAANPPEQAGTFALVGATVITGTDAPPMAGATVLIRDGRIAAVGPAATVAVPRGTPAVDVSGTFITAGLWDMHAHASQTDWALPYLAGGVTTIRDMGGEDAFLVPFRDTIASGRGVGPRVLLACLVDGSGPNAFGAVTADTPGQGVAVVDRYHAEHCDQMKIYDDVKPGVVEAISAEAHRFGMTVTGHVPRGMTPQGAVEAGFDHLAHMHLTGQPGSDASKAQMAFYKAHNTVMDPTESWNELGGHPAAVPIASFLTGIDRLPLTLRRQFAGMPGGTGDPAAAHARLVNSLKLLKDAIDAGLVVVNGTDKGVPGLSLQRDIELFVAGGMTPLEAIRCATIMPARAMRLEKESGTVEAGKRADLAIFARDPLADIANITTAEMVVANGRLWRSADLWRAAGYAPR